MTEMNVYDKRIKSAETTIKIALIIRLCGISFLIFLWVKSYLYPNYFEKSNDDIAHLIPVILGFVLDVLLTVGWFRSFMMYVIHSILFMLLGGVFYFFYVADTFNYKFPYRFSIWKIYDMFEIGINAAVIWCLSLIPFIMCAISNNDLARAEYAKRCLNKGNSVVSR